MISSSSNAPHGRRCSATRVTPARAHLRSEDSSLSFCGLAWFLEARHLNHAHARTETSIAVAALFEVRLYALDLVEGGIDLFRAVGDGKIERSSTR
jgi:hypothetical protein